MADTPDQPKKRIVKNPDTFRERAVKASEAAGQPGKRSRVKTVVGKVLMPVLRPVGRFLALIFNRQPFIFLSKIIFPSYLRNSWRELQQVNWPSWQQSRALTFAVLIFAIVFGAAIAAVDYGLDKLFRNVLLK